MTIAEFSLSHHDELLQQLTILTIPPVGAKRTPMVMPTRCDNRHNRIAEAKEAAYGGLRIPHILLY
jgi:hypothetical protein